MTRLSITVPLTLRAFNRTGLRCTAVATVSVPLILPVSLPLKAVLTLLFCVRNRYGGSIYFPGWAFSQVALLQLNTNTSIRDYHIINIDGEQKPFQHYILCHQNFESFKIITSSMHHVLVPWTSGAWATAGDPFKTMGLLTSYSACPNTCMLQYYMAVSCGAVSVPNSLAPIIWYIMPSIRQKGQPFWLIFTTVIYKIYRILTHIHTHKHTIRPLSNALQKKYFYIFPGLDLCSRYGTYLLQRSRHSDCLCFWFPEHKCFFVLDRSSTSSWCSTSRNTSFWIMYY